MFNWRQISRSKWAVWFVLAFAMADAAAIYYAHNRLSTPWTEQTGGATGTDALFAAADAPSVTIKHVWPAAPVVAVRVIPARAPVAVPVRTAVNSSPVPEYRPLKLAVEDEVPVLDMGLAARIPRQSGQRVARLQRSGKAARRFEAAFGADIAGIVAQRSEDRPSDLAATPPQPAETAQTGAASGYAEIYAQLARDSGNAGGSSGGTVIDGPAQDNSAGAAPQAGPEPATELPPIESATSNEIPPG